MQKKILKALSIVLILVISYVFFEMTSISTKIVNREVVSFNLNNIRNPQVKRMMRFLDNHYASFLLLVSKDVELYYNNNDERDKLPEEKVIKKTETFSKNLFPLKNNGNNWHRNHAGHASNRFSKLKKINKENIDKLSVAWEYKIDEKNIKL